MTQGLKDFFNLPTAESVVAASEDPSEDFSQSELAETIAEAEKSMAFVTGADHARAMDTVFDETMKHARDIVDLGFNVDAPRAARMLEVAATYYDLALKAKNSKRDAELDAMKIALAQRKLELEDKLRKGETNEIDAKGEAVVAFGDRNELLAKLREKK